MDLGGVWDFDIYTVFFFSLSVFSFFLSSKTNVRSNLLGVVGNTHTHKYFVLKIHSHSYIGYNSHGCLVFQSSIVNLN